MVNKYILIRNLAILFIACNLLFWLFPLPPITWRLSLVALSIIVMLNKKEYLPCEKAVLFFAAFNLLHFFISYFWKTPSTSSIGNVLCGLLSLSLFTSLSEKGVMQGKTMTIIGIILILSSALCYYYYDNLLLGESGNDETTNSYSEFFLMLLPLLFYVKKPVIKWLMLLVCMFFLIIGTKRGNIIAALLPVIILLYQVFKESRQSVWKTILTIVLLTGGSILVFYWVGSNEYLSYRFEQTKEGDSSGRDIIYRAAWDLWLNSDNVFTYLFGNGYDGVVSKLKVAAHSDWLEILVDYGLLGILLYLLVFFHFFRQIRLTKYKEIRAVLLSAVSILFIKSFYSMSFNTSTLPLLMIGLGTALGQFKNSQAQ